MNPRVWAIGIAPGCRELGEEAKRVLSAVDLVVTAERHRALLEGCYGGEVLGVEYRVTEAVERVAAAPELRAAFLASGDPGFFGVAALLSRKLLPGELVVLPAVSSMQCAFALAGESWSDARMASLHGRPLESLAAVLGAPKIGLFTDGANSPAAIARFLVDAGWDDLEMVVCADVGLETQQVERGPVTAFLEWRGSDLNVVLLLGSRHDPRPLGPGLPVERFRHPRGRITKPTVRAAALGLLELPRAGVLWDVGAGSGSVGIEAALLAPGLRVYCVEKDAEAFADVVENRKTLRAAGVRPIHGEAPGPLGELEAPDRVFVGGSGGNLGDILDIVFDKLAPGGLVVVSTVLAETFAATLEWAKRTGRGVDWMEVSVARSHHTGAGTRLAADNPVTLIRLREKEDNAS